LVFDGHAFAGMFGDNLVRSVNRLEGEQLLVITRDCASKHPVWGVILVGFALDIDAQTSPGMHNIADFLCRTDREAQSDYNAQEGRRARRGEHDDNVAVSRF
jgi:hypothetical protein